MGKPEGASQFTCEKMKITGIYAIAPSILKTQEEFTLRFKVLTDPYPADWACWIKVPKLKGPFNQSPRGIRYLANVYSGDVGSLEINIDGRRIRFSDYHGIFPGDLRKFGKISGLKFDSPGIKFIRVIHAATGIHGVSNPIVVKEKVEHRIYWGDLHSQTFFSDGLRCPEELYTFARDEAFLDFFSVSDHSEWITDRQWDYFCSVANDFNDEGRFVTFVAQEWTDHKAGHRNIYYPGSAGQILRAGINDIGNVYDAARKYNGLVIPHHSASRAMGVNWDLSHDSQVEKLVEIYSVWGNSETGADRGNQRPIRVIGGEIHGQHVVDALNKGYMFGFVGGGDIHDGRPGDELHTLQKSVSGYENLYRQGITAVRTQALDRNSVFNALYERRCYATSNIRPVLDFSINGIESGNILVCPKKLFFEISGISEIPVSRVVIVSDGKDYRIFDIRRNQFEIEFEQDYKGEKYFYARFERIDGELAWLSPVWIKS